VIIAVSNLNRVSNSLLENSLAKFAVKWLLKIPAHLAHVAAAPLETIMLKTKD